MGHYFRWSFNVLEWNENSKEPMTCRTNRHCNCQWSQPLDEPTALHHVVERISFHFQPYYMLLALPLITIIFFFCCSALLISLLLQQCNGNFGSLLRAALSVEHSTELLCFYLQRWLFSTMVRVYKFPFRKKKYSVWKIWNYLGRVWPATNAYWMQRAGQLRQEYCSNWSYYHVTAWKSFESDVKKMPWK